MSLRLFWNELAELPLAGDHTEARNRMEGFLDTCAALIRAYRAAPPMLRSREPIDGVLLSEGYTVAHWRRDADRDRHRLFLRLAASVPLLSPPEDGEESLRRFGCADCWHGSERALGLRAAWAADELAISLASDPRWRWAHLPVEVEVLAEDLALVRRPEKVRHLLAPEHVDTHQAWLRQKQVYLVRDGRDLWDRRSQLFPSLEFCRSVQRQIDALDAGSDALRNVLGRLIDLERAFALWDGGPLHPGFVPSKCTPETPQTLKEEADDHTAIRSSGQPHLFKWKVFFTPGAGRIFFDGDARLRRGIIGYVGIKKDGKLS